MGTYFVGTFFLGTFFLGLFSWDSGGFPSCAVHDGAGLKVVCYWSYSSIGILFYGNLFCWDLFSWDFFLGSFFLGLRGFPVLCRA